jgi:hypothetical protein
MTLISQKLENITSTVDTIKVQTNCSDTANSELCTYLSNTNLTVNDIKSNWGSYTAEDLITKLTELNTTTQKVYSYILSNVSTQANITEILAQINNMQGNITFVKNNMFYQGNATGALLVDYVSIYRSRERVRIMGINA